MNDLKELWEKFVDLIPVLLLAAAGGIANTMYGKPRGERYSLRIAIPEIVLAIFSGIVVHYICQHFNVSVNLSAAAIALAGYSARGVLALLNKMLIGKLKKL